MPYLLTTTKYAKQGDEVQVVSEHAEVFIVEDKQGVRFSIRAELLSDTRQGEETQPETEHPLIATFRKQLTKLGRSKYKALIGAVEDGLIKQELPTGVTKEDWLKLSKSIL